LTKKTTKEDLRGIGTCLVSVMFIEGILDLALEGRPAKIKKFVKAQDAEENLFYYFSDFLAELKKIKRDFDEENLKKCSKDFLGKLQTLASPYQFQRMEKFLDGAGKNDMDKLIRDVRVHVERLKSLRRDGRPYKLSNLVLFHLVNSQTFILQDKRKKRELRDWDAIAFILLWLHFHPLEGHAVRFKEVFDFIKSHALLSTKEALSLMRKWLQTEYSHFKPTQRGYYVKDRKGMYWKPAKVISKIPLVLDDDYKVIEL
jgi:hypothetical protein